jgi:hypothetical protein
VCSFGSVAKARINVSLSINSSNPLFLAASADNDGKSGWFATGFKQDNNEDHCVSLCGYGTISWLALNGVDDMIIVDDTIRRAISTFATITILQHSQAMNSKLTSICNL